jgi:anhydro-N-acetylmuramic acid kinase
LADLAVGGEGAPLVPHGHKILFDSKGKSVAVQNLGGIGNVTILQNGKVVTAFDTGPGNLWIDTISHWKTNGKKSFDEEGRLARKGKPDLKLAHRLLRHPYFQKKPPKSTGWEELGETYLQKFKKELLKKSLHDSLATVTIATSLTLAKTYHQFFKKNFPKEVVICGGGGKNRYLVELISLFLPKSKVFTSDQKGIPVDQVESISFALLALETIHGKPNNEPNATGAKRPVVLGLIAHP